MKTLQESIFDANLANKNLYPIDIAKLIKNSDLINTNDGSKDALGQSLKTGDIVLVDDGTSTNFVYGVYTGKHSGREAEIIKIKWVGKWPPKYVWVSCRGIIKLDEKYYKYIL